MNIKLKGVDKAIKDLGRWTDEREKEVSREVAKSALNVQRVAKRNVVSDEGTLRASISVEVRGLEREVFTESFYAPYVEFGTKSKVDVPAGLEGYAQQFRGRRGTFEGLLKNIEGWTRRKGIEPEAVYPIARSIARTGVSARPFMFPAAEQEKPNFEKAIEKVFK